MHVIAPEGRRLKVQNRTENSVDTLQLDSDVYTGVASFQAPESGRYSATADSRVSADVVNARPVALKVRSLIRSQARATTSRSRPSANRTTGCRSARVCGGRRERPQRSRCRGTGRRRCSPATAGGTLTGSAAAWPMVWSSRPRSAGAEVLYAPGLTDLTVSAAREGTYSCTPTHAWAARAVRHAFG